MDQLDAVYRTFSKLEQNYKRSTKTRTEYLREKFGGDIDRGMFLILHALSQNNYETAEDIAKMSFIRDIFACIKENKDKYETISSFDNMTAGSHNRVVDLLNLAEANGTGVSFIRQVELATNKREAINYRVTADGTRCADFATAEYFKVSTTATAAVINMAFGARVAAGGIYQKRFGSNFQKVDAVRWWKSRSK